MNTTPRVVIIGGGISGLAAAWRLVSARMREPVNQGIHPRVTVLEADGHLGGKIRTTQFAGVPVDLGPDAFLARQPAAIALCRELGIEDLISPSGLPSFIATNDELRPLPKDSVLGVPSSLRSLAATKLVSPLGMARASLDYVLPQSRNNTREMSVRDVVGSRLGREVLERVVEPLIGGINAGTADSLSISATAPQIAQLHTLHRSLLKGARKTVRNRAKNDSPTFMAPRNGMATLIEALEKRLTENGVEIHTDRRVESIRRDGSGWAISTATESFGADAVIFATPAHTTAPLISSFAPSAANSLASIKWASVGIIRLAYSPASVGRTLDGSGYLVPATEQRLTTACSWSTSKWPALARSEKVILRASVGRINDTRAFAMDDDALIEAVHEELRTPLALSAGPRDADVTRWIDAFPQFEVGHGDRIQKAKRDLQVFPSLFLVGAAINGLGVPSCIKTANETSDRLLALCR